MASFRSFLLLSLCSLCIPVVPGYSATEKKQSSFRQFQNKMIAVGSNLWEAICCLGGADVQQPKKRSKSSSSRHRCPLCPVWRFCRCYSGKQFNSLSYFKAALEASTNTEFSIDFSIMPQWFYPRKDRFQRLERLPAWQCYFAPSLSWQVYDSPEAGSGTIDFSYTVVRYWRNKASVANITAGIIGEINDYNDKSDRCPTLTFTQTFPKELVAVTLGQYNFYDFDGTRYDNSQFSGFISYALSQNATATYSSGSMGAYMSVRPISSINVQFGFQDAYNITGNGLDLYNLTKNRYNCFGSISWKPSSRLGEGHYSALIYNTRKVPQQLSQTTGWSFNAGQELGEKLYIFGRWNGSSGSALPISRSYVLGLASANPFCRNIQDLFGVACAINKTNQRVVKQLRVHKYETVIETFATIGFGPYLSITPDFQLYLNPAINADKHSARVFGLRANLSI